MGPTQPSAATHRDPIHIPLRTHPSFHPKPSTHYLSSLRGLGPTISDLQPKVYCAVQTPLTTHTASHQKPQTPSVQSKTSTSLTRRWSLYTRCSKPIHSCPPCSPPRHTHFSVLDLKDAFFPLSHTKIPKTSLLLPGLTRTPRYPLHSRGQPFLRALETAPTV